MARLEELDEELAVERGNRAKAEKSRTMLKKDIEDIASRLEEAGSNTSTQVELNKKREGELARLKGELEELNIAHEGTLAALRMKHNNTMSELGEQIDGINGNKMKAEKDKAGMERDLQEARSNLEDAVRAKAEMDKNGKLLQGSIVDSHQKLDELARALNEADSQKKRLDVEKQDLERPRHAIALQCLASLRIFQPNSKIFESVLMTSINVSPMLLRPYPRPRLRFNCGVLDMRPKAWDVLMS